MYKSVLNNNAGPIPYIEELLDYNKIEQISEVMTTNKKGIFIPYTELNYNNYYKIGNVQILGNNTSKYRRCPWDCHFIIDSGVVVGTDYSRSTSFFIPLKNQNENIKILDVNNAVMLNDNSLTYTCSKNGIVFQGHDSFLYNIILINGYECFTTTKYAKAGDVLTWTNYNKPDYTDNKSNTFYNKNRYFIPFKN